MRGFLVLVLIGAMLAPTFAMAAETIKIGGDVAVTINRVKVASESNQEKVRRQRKERRKLGATYRNVKRIMKDLAEKEELSDDPGIAKFQVAEVLLEENPQAFMDVEAAALARGEVCFDWDNFLEFIERLIELIMRIINLFSYVMPADPGICYVPPDYQMVA